MEGFHDIVHHTHEFVIHGEWVHALRREATNGPCGIVQTKWECCRGALGEVFQG